VSLRSNAFPGDIACSVLTKDCNAIDDAESLIDECGGWLPLSGFTALWTGMIVHVAFWVDTRDDGSHGEMATYRIGLALPSGASEQ
jgi:hypothetical protein